MMEKADLKNIVADLEYLAAEKNNRMILNILVGNHPADLADIIRDLSEEHGKYVFGALDADTASDVLVEMDDIFREKLLSELKEERLSEIVDEMDSDDATDIVAELPEEVAEKILEAIDEEDSAEVKELLRHEEDSAGGIMALEFVSVSQEQTVDEAIREIRKKAEEVSEVYNVWVVGQANMLVGVLPLKKLLLARSHEKVKDIMNAEVLSVPAEMDQEEVANFFRRYDLISVPVVDHGGQLVGRITVDDVVDVMEEEASEDIQKMAGLTEDDELHETSILKISFGRLPWLLVALVGQLIAAMVLSQFETSFKDTSIIVIFIPLMMAMGGNAGIQAATIIVRGMALGQLNAGGTAKRLGKEVKVALLNGTVCGIALFALIAVLDAPPFAFVLSISMLIVILNASLFGASIPLMLRRVGVDPALATGPLITTFNDIVGLFIYLALVTAALQHIR